jgi:hypothetical protein
VLSSTTSYTDGSEVHWLLYEVVTPGSRKSTQHATTCKVIESEWCLRIAAYLGGHELLLGLPLPDKFPAPHLQARTEMWLCRGQRFLGSTLCFAACINTINNKRDSRPIPALHHAH